MSTRTPIIKLAGAAALLLTLGLTGPVDAATGGTYAITVTTNSDTPVGAPSNCLAGGAGYSCSLRQATEAASTGPGGTYTITVPAGTYTLRYGPLTLDNNTISVVGYSASSTIVDGSGNTGSAAGSDFVIGSGGNTSGGAVTLKNLTITHGTGTTLGSNPVRGTSGGGVLVQCCTVNLTFDAITANTAFVGGGVANNAGTVTITNSAITNNSVDYYAGGIFNNTTMTIRSSNISGNVATGANGDTGYGGGIGTGGYFGPSSLQMTYSTVNNNIAGGTTAAAALSSGNTSYGGGIYNFGTTQITGGQVDNNVSAYTAGGVYNSGTLTMNALAIASNQAGYYGGGVNNEHSNSMTGVSLTGNTAGGSQSGYTGYGGGDYNAYQETITNSTFSSNGALGSGCCALRAQTLKPQAAPPGGMVHGNLGGPVHTQALQANSINSGTSYGGGLFVDGYNNGQDAISTSNFFRNAAYDGGGIFDNGAPLSTNNVAMRYNTASNDGGAVYINGFGSYGVSFYDTTITLNTAAVQTGGVYNTSPGDFSQYDSSITGNTGGTCPNIFQPCS